MELRDSLLRVGVFLAVFAVATILTGLGSVPIPTDGPNQTAPLTVESHQPDSILAQPPEETGDVTADSTGTGQTVVIDQSHNNSVTPDQISPFVTRLLSAGHEVVFYTDEMADHQSLNRTLARADAFVVVAPGEQYNTSEQARVARFADRGGRVLLVNEPTAQVGDRSTQPTPMTNLAGTFGLGFDAGYLYNLQTYDTNHRAVFAVPATEGPLTRGVDRLTVYTARPVVGGSAAVVTNGSTRLSTTRRDGAYTVLAREGNAVALGDRSLLGPDYVHTSDNEVLVSNLIEFLVSGSR